LNGTFSNIKPLQKVSARAVKAKPMDEGGQVCVDYGICLQDSVPLYVGLQDFTIAVQGTSTATVMPGNPATYTFLLTPSGSELPTAKAVSPLVNEGATFPAKVTFTTSGLPAGWVPVFTPSSIPAGSGATAVTMVVPTTSTTVVSLPEAGSSLASRFAPLTLALLLLPFAARLRKSGKRMARFFTVLLILGSGVTAITGLSGCGARIGYFGQTPKTYTVTVTATMGSLSHDTQVTLTVQ